MSKVINTAAIVDGFYEDAESRAAAYALMGYVTDFEYDVFDDLKDQIIATEAPAGVMAVIDHGGVTKRVSASQYSVGFPHPMIALAISNVNEGDKLESFALFANEGKGFVPIHFSTEKAPA